MRLPRDQMIPSSFLTLLSLMLVLSTSVSAAWSSPQQGTGFNLEGKITEQTPGKITVSTEDNIIFHVSYDEKTQIYRKDGSKGSAQDLKVGITIKLNGELSPTGVVEAHRIDLE